MKYLASLIVALLVVPAALAQDASPYPPQAEDVPWPTEVWAEAPGGEGSERARLEEIISTTLSDKDVPFFRDGRGVVVVHKGRIVAEVYGEGFDQTSLFLSWSMAKSVTQALVGAAVGRELLDVDAPVDFEEWQGTDKAAITLDDLLRMSSGLQFVEGAGGLDDNSQMMYGMGRHDQGLYAASLPLIHEPGSHWAYATGTTMVVSRAVRQVVGDTGDAYFDFMHEALFEPIGMKSAVPEFDQVGTFLGGTSFFATTRDYARFGLLYLRDGVWEGQRVLPEGWVDYTRSATPNSNGLYGTHFWLGLMGDQAQLDAEGLSLPEDMFQARGAMGQFIVIVPSLDVVIAYNGASAERSYAPAEVLFARILAALEAGG